MLRCILELFELTLPSQLRLAHVLLGYVLLEALFEFKEAPRLVERLVMPIQPDQEEIRDDRKS